MIRVVQASCPKEKISLGNPSGSVLVRIDDVAAVWIERHFADLVAVLAGGVVGASECVCVAGEIGIERDPGKVLVGGLDQFHRLRRVGAGHNPRLNVHAARHIDPVHRHPGGRKQAAGGRSSVVVGRSAQIQLILLGAHKLIPLHGAGEVIIGVPRSNLVENRVIAPLAKFQFARVMVECLLVLAFANDPLRARGGFFCGWGYRRLGSRRGRRLGRWRLAGGRCRRFSGRRADGRFRNRSLFLRRGGRSLGSGLRLRLGRRYLNRGFLLRLLLPGALLRDFVRFRLVPGIPKLPACVHSGADAADQSRTK